MSINNEADLRPIQIRGRRATRRSVRLRGLRWVLLLIVVSGAVLTGAHAAPLPPNAASFDFSQYEGRVVVLDFWASWCPPCRRSFPWLNAMKKKYEQQGLVVVGVNADAKWSDAERFLQEFPADFQLVVDSQRTLRDKFSVTGMPTTLVFDRHGEMVAKHLGFEVARQPEYEQAIQRALAE